MDNDTNDQRGSLQNKHILPVNLASIDLVDLSVCQPFHLLFLSANLSICGEGCLLYISRDDMADMSRVRSSSMWIL